MSRLDNIDYKHPWLFDIKSEPVDCFINQQWNWDNKSLVKQINKYLSPIISWIDFLFLNLDWNINKKNKELISENAKLKNKIKELEKKKNIILNLFKK